MKEGGYKAPLGSARRQGPGEGEVERSWKVLNSDFPFLVL